MHAQNQIHHWILHISQDTDSFPTSAKSMLTGSKASSPTRATADGLCVWNCFSSAAGWGDARWWGGNIKYKVTGITIRVLSLWFLGRVPSLLSLLSLHNIKVHQELCNHRSEAGPKWRLFRVADPAAFFEWMWDCAASCQQRRERSPQKLPN